MNIIGSTWFSNSTGCIGIIIVKTLYDGPRAYIGVVDGMNKEFDELRIANYGSSFPLDIAENLIFNF